jgi:hypothetical protein
MSVIIDGSAGVTTNAGGSVNPSTNVEGINYSCRAWVNFNGTGTVAIRGSGNVTSITDNGTGDYTVNFTTAMTDANYSVVGGGSRTAVNMLCITARNFATSSVNITPIDTANNKVDSDITTVAIIR